MSAQKPPGILVTGAAGFIGSNFVEIALSKGYRVIALDALTYAGHRENLQEFEGLPEFTFVHGKIQDQSLVSQLLETHGIQYVANFAAESHVDRSITGPGEFIDTNIQGTFAMLSAARAYYEKLEPAAQKKFRFLQVSTDEVFGSLGSEGKFSEVTPYQPNSPYSASKASADLLVRAWFHTYQFPVITTNCSNNYGPKQFPEKLIPHMIFNALSDQPLPVYGDGKNIRDWIHVQDHANGVLLALEKGKPGEVYCLGGNSERKNLDVVKAIAQALDEMRPRKDGKKYGEQIQFVTDRPGHDFRYAIDDSKALRELGYQRQYSNFEDGLRDTLQWYLEHLDWTQAVTQKSGAKLKYNWSELGKG